MAEYIHEIDADETARIARFLRWLAIGTVLFVLLIIVLFVTADRWLRLISIESERRFIEPYIGLLTDSEFMHADPALQSYVSKLTKDIHLLLSDDKKSQDEQLELRVFVIDGSMVNAFATLGGYIFVFEGLIDAVENENSLAMVLGHEVAHIHNRDPLLGTGRVILLQLAISTLSGSGIDPNAVNMSSDVLLNQYSREQELAADALALNLVQRRYGHIGGATRLFEIIDDEADQPELAEFLSTHPDTDARIDAIDALAGERGWIAGDPQPYPEAVRSALQD